jgi:tripartite-type tricarboxylate transporter receptor subunit TctC
VEDGSKVKLPRRNFLRLAAGAAALPAVSRFASAQSYPSRPVRIIVGFPPAGAADIIGRLLGQSLSERLSQQFIVENRGGAGGNLGTEAVVRSPADGYTLLLAGSNDAINATLYEKLNFNFIRDIEPVAGIARVPNVMVVNLSVPAKTVSEFIAYAKANPGRINMASAGSGTPNHMSGELFKAMTGVNLVHVPYRGGGPALADLLGGQVQVTFSPMPTTIETIRAGKPRALAVTTAMRSDALPDIPTWVSSCLATRRVIGLASARRKTRRSRSSRSSTRRSTLASPILGSRRGLPTSVATCSRSRPPTLEG